MFKIEYKRDSIVMAIKIDSYLKFNYHKRKWIKDGNVKSKLMKQLEAYTGKQAKST